MADGTLLHMNHAAAFTLLRQMLGPACDFRDGQWEAIDLVANQRRRLLVVQRTGWGKSIVYFLATKILRDAGGGPTLLVSPLLALMRNQLLAAEKLGLRAWTLHSENSEEWAAVEQALRENRCDLLLVSPERLGNAQFMQTILPLFQPGVGLFVVDEAHCISDWGHDFRPDYRRIVRVLRLLPPNVPALCTTATANDRVVEDVLAQIPNLQVSRGPLIRHSLRLFNIKLADQADRLAWLAHFVPQLPGSGIIYCLTIEDTRRVATWLQQNGISACSYNAQLESGTRIVEERQLLANEVKALVATVALGMGFDKPDLGFVIHFQRPASVVAYYQQVGRAGRAVDNAFGILLSGREDDEISDYFIRTAFPPAETMTRVLEVIERGRGSTIDEIGAELNQSRGTLEKALKLLEVEGAVLREKYKVIRTANAWRPETLRAEQITAKRRAEVEQMRRYVEHDGCLMEFLARALDDPAPQRCGKCMNCAKNTTRRLPPPALVRQAADFLRGDALVLDPRTRWPKPLLVRIQKQLPEAVESFERGGNLKVVIPEKLHASEGRVLCVYGDAGWGGDVARGKYHAGSFSDELVAAAAELIQQKWKPNPAPQWIAAVPSLHREKLVGDFAARLAARLGLPFHPILVKARDTQPQKEMQSSATQLGNVIEAFRVTGIMDGTSGMQRLVESVARTFGSRPALPPGPVLLIDDVVDSGWTLTWLAVTLRAHGSGPVYPFALAKASPRGS